ncbi:MAG TPA: MFS transporter [Candidatus Dormibacteraeota bacterium]|nr:MFS transporter [Candidatus Dormibacteraeota bacterium]
MSTDLALLLLGRVLRAFGFGFSPVLLGLLLEHRGLGSAAIGLALTVGLLAAALSGLGAAAASRRFGRRPVLAAAGLAMAITGGLLFVATNQVVLVLAGATGMLGAAGLDVGPFLSVEQPMLAETVGGPGRNLAFARYSLSGALAGAAGGLAATLAAGPSAYPGFFLGFAGIGLVTALLPLLLTERVEARPEPGPRFDVRPIAGLAALFGLDALGGGFIANAVIAYWLHARFGVGAGVLGPAFAAIGLLQAAAYEVSGRLGNRFGLVNTMVFTHLPSNVLLLLVPFSPNLGWALALLLARFSMSQMDVPARQAYIVSIVPPAHRASAVATTAAVRGIGQAAGPLLSGLAIQAALYGLPFFAGGALKIVYDLGLYAGFRRRRAEHETAG